MEKQWLEPQVFVQLALSIADKFVLLEAESENDALLCEYPLWNSIRFISVVQLIIFDSYSIVFFGNTRLTFRKCAAMLNAY